VTATYRIIPKGTDSKISGGAKINKESAMQYKVQANFKGYQSKVFRAIEHTQATPQGHNSHNKCHYHTSMISESDRLTLWLGCSSWPWIWAAAT